MMGALNLFDAIVAHLPVALQTETGASVEIRWQPRRSLPRGAAAQAYPRGVFEIVDAGPMFDRSRWPAGVEQSTLSQTDPFVFADGTLDYVVTQEDIAAVQSVTGTVGGTPGHVFVLNTDYEIFDRSTIRWIDTGTLPDDATAFSVIYTHYIYARLWNKKSRIVVRTMLYVKDATIGGREYPKESLAQVLGESLEQILSRRAGRVLSKPNASPTPAVPMTRQGMGGRVLASRPGVTDESESVATWIIDFRVHRNHIFADAPVQRIADIDLDQA